MHSVLCICKRFVSFGFEWDKANYQREIGHTAAARRRTKFASMHILAYGQKYLRIHFLCGKPNLCWIDCGKRSFVCVQKFAGAVSFGRNTQPHTKPRISPRGEYSRPGQLHSPLKTMQCVSYARHATCPYHSWKDWILSTTWKAACVCILCDITLPPCPECVKFYMLYEARQNRNNCLHAYTAYIIIMGHWAMPTLPKTYTFSDRKNKRGKKMVEERAKIEVEQCSVHAHCDALGFTACSN